MDRGSTKTKTILLDLENNPLVILPNILLGDERVIYIRGDKYIPSGSSLSIDLEGITKRIYVREVPNE